jgi:hypothetical protein
MYTESAPVPFAPLEDSPSVCLFHDLFSGYQSTQPKLQLSNSYAFFRRAAQRFRIASARRSLPAGVSPRRFFPDVALGEVDILAVDDFRPFPSSASIARLNRSLSIFKSATIFARSKVRSFFRYPLTG